MLQNQDESALKILDETEYSQADLATLHYRKIIRAKALFNNGNKNEALKLIKDDMSKNALLLQSEIYWKTNDWGNAADTIKYLIDRPEANKELSEEQIKLILDWATALKKSGRETMLCRLRKKVGPS